MRRAVMTFLNVNHLFRDKFKAHEFTYLKIDAGLELY